jgi:hypothetical protein
MLSLVKNADFPVHWFMTDKFSLYLKEKMNNSSEIK